MRDAVPDHALTQEQFDAAVSFAYNVPGGARAALSPANRGDMAACRTEHEWLRVCPCARHPRPSRGTVSAQRRAGHSAAKGSRTDASGRLENVTNALGETTRVSYTADGLPESVTRPDLQVDQYKWNALGFLIEHVSPAGHTERWERDALGRMTGYTDAEGRRVGYGRDAHGRPLRLVNGNGASYRFEWDPVGRLLREQRVDGSIRQFGYSETGFLQHIASQAGASQRMDIHNRDALGRLTRRQGEHSQTTYRYDRLGQLGEARRIPTTAGELLGIVADTVRFEYDETGRLLVEHGVHGSVKYERDVLGNPVLVTLPDGQRTETLYYGSGHAHQLRVNGEAVADFERDALHREIRRTQGTLALHTGYTRMGQTAWQRASAMPVGDDVPSEADSALWWRYRYDSRGELIESLDRLHGRTVYDYDRGRSTAAAQRRRV